MQSLIIEGYLAADPSILSAQGSGKKRASFRVLETAEKYIEPFARKGTRVVIQGHVENDSWTGRDNVEHYDLRVVVSDIRLKNRRDQADQDPGEGRQDHEPTHGYDLNDDIPF